MHRYRETISNSLHKKFSRYGEKCFLPCHPTTKFHPFLVLSFVDNTTPFVSGIARIDRTRDFYPRVIAIVYKFQCTITIAVGIIITKEFKRFYLIKRNGMLHLQLGTICTRHVTRIVGCVGAASLTPTRIATCRPVQRNSNFPAHSLNIHCTR